MDQDKIISLLFKILKDYGVSITFRSIEQEVKTHPEYTSMQCLSDVLNSWKVKHVVMQLTMEKLRTLDVPVVAHLKRGEFVWITLVKDSKVYLWSATGKEKVESIERFEQDWSGVALAIYNIDDAGEPDYKEKRRKELKEQIFKFLISGGIVTLIAVLTCFSWTKDISFSLLPKLLLLFTNIAGCYVSYLLIRQEKHQSDALTDKFCKAGKYVDCKKVTESKYSIFLGLIPWTELGAAYYSSMLLWVTIAPLSDDWMPPLWWFSIVVLPFTLWSLVMQAFVIRKWCLFCCTVVFLLWVNAAILLVCYPHPVILSIPESVIFALLFIFSLIVVMKASKTVGAKARSYAQQREIAKIKFNVRTIQSQLSELTQPTEKSGVTFGNPDSSRDIGLLVNISCSHCSQAIKEFRRLIEIYPDFNYRLLFSVNSDDFDDKTNDITRNLLNLYKTLNKNEFFEMLDIWYTMPQKTLEALQKLYPFAIVHDCKNEMDALFQFNRQNKINYTPALFLNGQLLSNVYSYKDLQGIARVLNCEE